MAIVLVFLLYYLEIAGAQNISIDPLDIEVLEGGTITLTCEVTNYKETYILHWNRIDGNLTGQERTTEVTVDGKVILQINAAQIQDAGTYFCTMYDKEQKTVQLSLASTVTVLFGMLAKYPLCAFSQYLSQLKVGTTVVLRCQYPVRDLKNATSLIWEKGDQEKVDGKQWNNFDQTNKIMYSYLNFTAKEDLHDATFTCTYHNQSIRSEDQVCHVGPIGVHYAPKVKVYPQEITVDPGDQIYFNCSGPAQPALVTYLWHIIPETKDIKTQSINKGETLILTDISTQLSGNDFDVKCAAINNAGVTNTKAVLHIKSDQSNKPLMSEDGTSSTTLLIFPVVIAVAVVCFIFLLIFIISFLASRKKDKNTRQENPNNILELHNPDGTAPIQRVEENPYAIVNAEGLVVNLPMEPEQEGAYAIKAGEFVKDDVELIVKE